MVAQHAKRSRVYEYEDAEMMGCENLRAGLPTAGDEKVGKLVRRTTTRAHVVEGEWVREGELLLCVKIF